MIDRDAIVAAHPIADYLTRHGREVTRKGKLVLARCVLHTPDNHPSMRIDEAKQAWFCDVCGKGGSVIDADMILHGGSVADAMARLGAGLNGRDMPAVQRSRAEPAQASTPPAADEPEPRYILRRTYEYRDAADRLRYVVERHEDQNEPQPGRKRRKKFVQFRADPDGTLQPGLRDTPRMLYRLSKVMRTVPPDPVLLVEGEKCVQAAEHIGYTATTNSGGASGWLDALAEPLAGKAVVLMADDDPAGQKWGDAVRDSLRGIVASLRIISAPKPHNDLADYVQAEGKDKARAGMDRIIAEAVELPNGYDVAVESVETAFASYRAEVKNRRLHGISIGAWLPDLSHDVRPLFRGDVVVLMADTGVGKTTIHCNLMHAIRRPTVFFQLELSNEQMAERFAALSHSMPRRVVERICEDEGSAWNFSAVSHVRMCKRRGVTVEDMADIVRRSALVFGQPVECVYVDYIGLVRSKKSRSRTEQTADVAESLKSMAVELGVVLFVTTQVHRRSDSDDAVVPSLHSAKDSSSVEASAQLLIGVWRPDETPETVFAKVLKYTNGRAGRVVECVFDGERGTITQKSRAPLSGAELEE